jgi:hypothetical protein
LGISGGGGGGGSTIGGGGGGIFTGGGGGGGLGELKKLQGMKMFWRGSIARMT